MLRPDDGDVLAVKECAALGAEQLAQQLKGRYRPPAPDACPDTRTVHGQRLAQAEHSAGAGRKKQ
jgi:hypothetical protein